MDIDKLNKWANLLLDTGKSNNLINFKDSASSSAEIVLPSAPILFKAIEDNSQLEVFDPKIADSDEPQESNQREHNIVDTNARERYISKYSSRIKNQKQLLVYNGSANPITALRNISKKSRAFIEETGVNVVYIALGFIHWTESESAQTSYAAPILLAPVSLEQESPVAPIYIKSTGDDIVVNPTFAYKLTAEYGIKLPNYDDETFDEYVDKVVSLLAKLDWHVSKDCKIGIFSFLKINMYKDLKDNAASILENNNVRALLGESRTNSAAYSDVGESAHVKNPLIDIHNVVDADSSQLEAIEMVKSGKSFVLQGPPGTGKSQTITNMIAECLYDEKKVLFVSEKLAALQVVYDKLKQVELADFCLELHSHKANKKDVIEELCKTLKTSKSAISSKANSEIAIKKSTQSQLDVYAEELHKPVPIINRSLYQLYNNFSSLRNAPEVEWTIPHLNAKGDDFLSEVSALLEQYAEFVPSVGFNYKDNPWYGYIKCNNLYQAKIQLKKSLESVVKLLSTVMAKAKHLSDKYAVSCKNINDLFAWQELLALLGEAHIVTPELLNCAVFSQVAKNLKEMQQKSAEIISLKTKIEEQFGKEFYDLNGAEISRKMAEQFGGFWSRLFSLEYWKIMKQLRLCKKDGRRLSYSDACFSLKQLADYQTKNEDYCTVEASIKAYLGESYQGLETDWESVLKQVDTLAVLMKKINEFGNLSSLSRAEFASKREQLKNFAEQLNSDLEPHSDDVRELCQSFDESVVNIATLDLEKALEKCQLCLRDLDKLDNWCNFSHIISELNEHQVLPFVDIVINNNIRAEDFAKAFEKQFFNQWIYYILSMNPVLTSFNRVAQDRVVSTFKDKDSEQFDINKASIRAKLSANRPSPNMVAAGGSVSVLIREGEKKRKQKNIRTLLSEIGELIQRIKPCFLMSPLSVSTFLSNDAIKFDVVIFDEASQIFPQDAIGAIYRAKQLVVVGDSKQMPPSDFFNSFIEDEDDDESGDVTDFESILDLCAATMPQLRLSWHYRSRYEQLIAFSNKNFYNNSLITFPSAKANDVGVGVDYYFAGGIFDRKSHNNRQEAEFVVNLIYKNIEMYPERSLGVVAFSKSQQELIDKLLARKRQENPDKEFFFKTDSNEAFFVKNLETVQGDERDTIIFSVAYGFDTQRRFMHNFGPLNRVGGERRLNVAVTRAKCNVQLVASIHCTDIDLSRTNAEGARLLREYLDFAENGTIALERSVSANQSDHFDSEFELEVCEFLRSNGFSVDTQVGCSGFKIDLGLKKPNSSDYVLAIECDGATYHSSKNARDRDRLRQQILERMGWKFYRIWSTEWFKNRAFEQNRLLEAANKAVKGCKNEKLSSNGQVAVTEEAKHEAAAFEEVVQEENENFQEYLVADIEALGRKFMPHSFKRFVKAILEVEAPLSEEFLLKRIVSFFDREKVTSVVKKMYEEKMLGCDKIGIIRKDGFLYLNDGRKMGLRIPGMITRDIKYIAPEELASGMLEAIKQNITIDKDSLYHFIASKCGFSRIPKNSIPYLDSALNLLASDISVDDNLISIQQHLSDDSAKSDEVNRISPQFQPKARRVTDYYSDEDISLDEEYPVIIF